MNLTRYRVLLVDDQKLHRQIIKDMDIWKSENRFELIGEASTGEDALRIVEEQAVDVIITDIIMPGIDGITLLKHIVENKQKCYVILMSSLADFEYARNGLIYGACDYLVKPVKQVQLQAALDRMYCLLEAEEANRYQGLSIEEVIGQICRVIANQGNLPEDVIIVYAQQIKNMPGFAAMDAVDAIKLALSIGLERLFCEYMKIDMMQIADILVRIYWNEDEPMACCIRSVRAVEKIYWNLVLPDIQNKLVRQTVCLVLGDHKIKKTVENMAQMLYVNRSHLSTVFKNNSGITLLEYLTRVKMYQARVFLIKKETSIGEVAQLLGYQDDEYFSKLFKFHTGMLPRDYRKIILNEING